AGTVRSGKRLDAGGAMSSQSQERRAYARALASGLIVPTLLIAAFLASARATYSPAPIPSKVAPPSTPSAIDAKAHTPSGEQLVSTRPRCKRPRAVAAPKSVANPKVLARCVEAPLPMTAQPAQAVIAITRVSSPTLALATCGDAYGFSDDSADHVFWALVDGG